jgi:hypothetical protein
MAASTSSKTRFALSPHRFKFQTARLRCASGGKPTLRRPYSLRRRVRRLPLFPLGKAEGMEHRVAHQSFRLAALSFGECGRLSALHRGFSVPGPAFPGLQSGFLSRSQAPPQRLARSIPGPETIGPLPVQRSSSRSGRSAARAGPRGLPSAGLRIPPAGAASGSILETSREDALS